jgi:phytoene synthase
MATDDPERTLALSYAVRGREAAAALFALDDRLAAILRRTSDPLVGQMRLTWWHEALSGLDTAPPLAEPVLVALSREALPVGVTPALLAQIVEGWEVLLEEPIDEDALWRHAGRGRALFAAIGCATGAANDPAERAGAGWALADLATHVSDREVAAAAARLAKPLLADAAAWRWSRAGRPLGALVHLVRDDLRCAPERPHRGAPRRIARMLYHRLTGC